MVEITPLGPLADNRGKVWRAVADGFQRFSCVVAAVRPRLTSIAWRLPMRKEVKNSEKNKDSRSKYRLTSESDTENHHD